MIEEDASVPKSKHEGRTSRCTTGASSLVNVGAVATEMPATGHVARYVKVLAPFN